MYAMPYVIISDKNLKPMTSFMRERIFKRSVCRWRGAVHELMFPEWGQVKNAKFNNIAITHLPIKPQYSSALRNIAILEHEEAKGNNSVQNRYFLARDLLLTNNKEKSVKIFTDMVDNMDSSYEMLYAICMDLIWFYAYGCYPFKTKLHDLKVQNHKEIENWIRLALSFCNDGAEPYVVLGDLYYLKGAKSAAERMWLTAMKKKIGATKLQSFPFYGEVPNSRLSLVYAEIGEVEKGLYHNKQCLKHSPKEIEYLRFREYLVKEVIKDFNKATSQNENREIN